jgi:streptogramin lyase
MKTPRAQSWSRGSVLLLYLLVAPAYSQGFTIEEFAIPTAGSQPAVITRGPDGNLFFTESGADRIGRITPSGVITDVPTRGLFTGLDGIAADTEGNIWATESSAAGGHIVKTNPALSTFSFGSAPPPCSPDSRPRGITAGPDGNLWVVLSQCNAILRFPPAFSPAAGTTFLIPTADSGVSRIAPGPDGALWFTELNANKIGRITTAGVITEYPVPTAGSGPHGIAAGPDGALWFTELNASKIGRITIAGAITEYVIPTPGSAPREIAAGADGALWFTEFNSNKLGRITVSGAITEYPVPTTGSGPNGITAGPLGSMWFTELNGNKVGRIRVAQPARNDFDGDGRSDVLWRNAATGENYLYPMDGTTILPGEGYLRTVTDLDWQVAGIGDFDGDGKSDILWRNRSSGQNYVYFLNGTTIKPTEGFIRAVPDQNWQVAGIGDFDGDGRDDILWRNPVTGENYLYFMDGLIIKPSEGYLRTVPDPAWQIVGVGDFDGDGKADVLWRNGVSGQNYVYPMDGTSIKANEGFVRTVADTSWQVKGVGDFDGDGKADIVWRNSSSGQNYLYPMDGTTIKPGEGYLRTVPDPAWRIVAVGDYDGDGKTDIFWRNSSSGENYLYPMDGTTIKPTEGYLRSVPDQNWQPQR